MWNGCNLRVIMMRGRGISFHGPVNSAEAGGHRSKPEVVPALIGFLFTNPIHTARYVTAKLSSVQER